MSYFDEDSKGNKGDWKGAKLKYISDMKSGETITHSQIKDKGEYPVYGGGGLRGYTSSYTHNGDRILIGRQGALCGNVKYAKDQFWASEHAIVVTSRPNINLIWLGLLLESMNLNQHSISAAQPGLSVSTIKNLKVLVPTPNEQDEIADFLDQKTSEIDTLITDKEKLIELLEEKRQAIITEAVTKGLNPDVKMKNSGVEWIGEIPGHWEVGKVGYVFEITLGKMIQPKRKNKTDIQVPYLKANNIQDNYLKYDKVDRMYASITELEKYRLLKSDLLVCEGGEVGRSAFVDRELEGYIFQNALHRVRGSNRGNVIYLHYLLNIVRNSKYINILVNRATIAHFTRDKFSSLKIPIPTYEEQEAIVNVIDLKSKEITEAKSMIKTQIQKLKEYRQSLIYEAVTGKIDVRNYNQASS